MHFRLFHSLTDERGGRNDPSAAARYSFAKSYVRKKRVLDIGCGLGMGASLLAGYQAASVVGIDYSPVAIGYAKKNFNRANLSYSVLDARNLRLLNGPFDVVTAFEVLEHLPRDVHDQFISDIARLLSPEGICLLSTPNRLVYSHGQSKSSNPFHQYEYTHHELKRLLKSHFRSVTIKGIVVPNSVKNTRNTMIVAQHFSALIDYACRYKITHRILGSIPAEIKSFLWQKNNHRKVRSADYKLVGTTDKAECFFAVARRVQ